MFRRERMSVMAGRTRRRPSFTCERLETRLAMSRVGPADILEISGGIVARPHTVAHVATIIGPRNLSAHRETTVIGLSARSLGGDLEPAIVSSTGPNGGHLALAHPRQSQVGVPGEVTTFTRTGQPGVMNTGVSGRHGSTGPFQIQSFLPGDVDGNGQVDLADLRDLAQAYLSRRGSRRYVPSADLNRDGKINQSDARLLERNLPAPKPDVPLTLDLRLAPGEQVPHPAGGAYNSGAITGKTDVTIDGKTLPGALVFVDSKQGFYLFDGPLLPTDDQGNFTYHLHLSDKLTAFVSFLVIDGLNRQLVRNYPIFQI
jgi:hypothetical protein